MPDGKFLCPNRPRKKVKSAYVQNFVRSPGFRTCVLVLSCVQTFVQTFVRSPDTLPSCPDIRALMSRLSCVLARTFGAFKRLFCIYVQTSVRSPDFCAFISRLSFPYQTFVRLYPYFSMFTRFLCDHQIFVR